MMLQNTNQPQKSAPQQPVRRPNETGVITVQGHLHIFDPQSQKTFVEKQA